MAGRIAPALETFADLYNTGADPATIISELAEFTHLVTRLKVVPGAAEDVSLTFEERERGVDLAKRLGMRSLSRTWQILFKGLEEVKAAANALQAAEMVLVRLAYAADLPTPDDLITKLQSMPNASAPAGGSSASAPRGGSGGGGGAARLAEVPQYEDARPQSAPQSAPQPTALAGPRTYAELIALAGEKRDLMVKHALESSLRPVSIAEGRLEVALVEGADPAIIQTLSARLKTWTNRTWMITLAREAAHVPTIREQRQAQERTATEAAHQDPLVQAILETFPGAIVRVNARLEQIPVEAYADAVRDSEEEDDE
jgi:DNA polymerase-3 subunit gamma/tau